MIINKHQTSFLHGIAGDKRWSGFLRQRAVQTVAAISFGWIPVPAGQALYDNSNLQVLYASVKSFHSPDEIMNELEASKKRFKLNSKNTSITNDITQADRLDREFSPYLNYRQKNREKSLYDDVPSKKLKTLWEQGRKQAEFDKSDLAFKTFAEAFDIDPKYFKTYTRFGEVLIHMKKPGDAVDILKKAVELNRIDWEAWYLLSIAWSEKGNREKARESIFHAVMLNKHDEKIQKHLQKMMKGSKYYVREKRFNAAFRIEKSSRTTIKIEFQKGKGEIDMALATCLAAWDHADGYREKMLGKQTDELELLKYKECLMSQGLAIATLREKDQYDKVPRQQRFLFAAILDDLVDAIVLWEFAANRDPYSVLLADEQQQRDIVKYLGKYVVIDRKLGI